MSQEDSIRQGPGMKRRTLIKAAAGTSAAGFVAASFTGAGAARPNGSGQRGPCHKNFECNDVYVKFEFIVERDDSGEIADCYFDEETDTGLIEITNIVSKSGDECEPIGVEWKYTGEYVASSGQAFGGNDCDSGGFDWDTNSYTSELENNGGNTAAISNLQFCLREVTLPECPMYGTSRIGSEDGEVEIWSIRYDSDENAIIEEIVGDIPDDSGNSNYPNGLAFDPENEVWYFTEEGGILKTMNEDGCLGINVYNGGNSITGGASIAGATLHDGGYYFTPQGGDSLWRVELNPDGGVAEDSEGNVNVDNDVRDLPLSNNTFGDIAAGEDGTLYFSVNGAFFKIDLDDPGNDEIIAGPGENDRETFAVLSQLAFDDVGNLWAHHAGTGAWRTVNLTDGRLNEIVDTTRTYTDLATCGTYELDGDCEQ